VRRLGFGFQFNQRMSAASLAAVRPLARAVSSGWSASCGGRFPSSGAGFQIWQGVEPHGVTLAAAVAGWSSRPAALPLQRGKLPGVEVKRVARHASERKARRQIFAAAVQRASLTARRAARRSAAAAKAAGELSGAFVPAVEHMTGGRSPRRGCWRRGAAKFGARSSGRDAVTGRGRGFTLPALFLSLCRGGLMSGKRGGGVPCVPSRRHDVLARRARAGGAWRLCRGVLYGVKLRGCAAVLPVQNSFAPKVLPIAY
jgi:hypothetical protein